MQGPRATKEAGRTCGSGSGKVRRLSSGYDGSQERQPVRQRRRTGRTGARKRHPTVQVPALDGRIAVASRIAAGAEEARCALQIGDVRSKVCRVVVGVIDALHEVAGWQARRPLCAAFQAADGERTGAPCVVVVQQMRRGRHAGGVHGYAVEAFVAYVVCLQEGRERRILECR